jgi:hypothetical protein
MMKVRSWAPQPCYDPATLAMISVGATIAGTAVSTIGTLASGRAAQQAANYQAAQMDMKGKEELAQGQQEAEQYRRKKQLALSTLQSRAAASGFEATDPTITEHGELQEGLAMYGGKSRREGLEAQARGKRFEGKAERIGSYYKAGATILGGVASIADKYAPRPKSKSDYLYG